MERDVENRSHAAHVGFGGFPRLGVGEVFVADAGEVHGGFEGVAEAELVEV